MTLSLINIAFERNYQMLFDNIHCELQAGDLLQVQGANGSGKTTLLRILAGLLEPEAGQILWNHQSIAKQRETYQQAMHFLGHQNGIKQHLTVIENLRISSALNTTRVKHISLHDTLEKMGLAPLADTLAMHLSAGQLRRLSLTRLLLRPAKLWILDEPATALDKEGQTLLTELLNHHVVTGGIAVLATHQGLSLQGQQKTLTLGEYHA